MEKKSKIWYGGFAFMKAFIFEHPVNQLTKKYFKHLKTKNFTNEGCLHRHSLKFILSLQVVFSSQQHLNWPAINAIQWRHSLPENRVVIVIGWLSKHSHNYV